MDRYFFFGLVGGTLAGVLFALVILLSLQAVRLGELLVRADVDFSILSKMIQGLSLSFTPIILPIAFLFASLSLFGRLSTDRELIALQGMGYSPWRLMGPCFLASVFLSFLTILCALFIAPYGNRLFEMAVDETLSKKGASVLRPGTFTEGFLDSVLYVGEKTADGKLKKIFLYDKSALKEEVVISATEANWNPPGENGWAQLQLIKGTLVSKNLEENTVRRIFFDEYAVNADFRYAEGKSRDSMESQDLGGLLQKRKQKFEKPEDLRWVWIELARRFCISLSFFFFVPFCFISSMRNQRTAQSRVVLTGVVLGVIYWGSYFSLISWVAKTHLEWVHFEPFVWILVMIPNIVIGVASLFLIKKRFGRILAT